MDGKLAVTLRGDDIVPEFLRLLDDYVQRKYVQRKYAQPVGATGTRA